MSLRPCPSCARHVRANEEACPFCAVALDPNGFAPPRALGRPKSRAAIVFFGAATAVAACTGGADEPTSSSSSGGSSSGGSSSGADLPAYGPAVIDAGED